jgi:DNA primase
MGQWIDFKRLRSQLEFEKVLKHYKVSGTRRGEQVTGFCPLPDHRGEQRTASFSANLARGIWQCFGCGAKGNALDFAVRMEGLSPANTANVRGVAVKLNEVFGLDCLRGAARNTDKGPPAPEAVSDLPAAAAKVSVPVKVNEPLDFELKQLDPHHPFFKSRRLSPETVSKFGLGFCSRGLMRGRIAIPLHDSQGRLVGYAGRVVDETAISDKVPEYRFPANRERNGIQYEFRKAELLYNAHRIAGSVGHLVVVQGCPAVWWIDQLGFHEVVALMGSTCSPQQATIILSLVHPSGRVSVLPDGDEAGGSCAHSLFERVGRERPIRWHELPPGSQSNALSISDLKMLFS